MLESEDFKAAKSRLELKEQARNEATAVLAVVFSIAVIMWLLGLVFA